MSGASSEEAFVAAATAWTRANHPGCVLGLEVLHDEDTDAPEVYVDTLEVPARRRGTGSAILRHLCRMADEAGIRLTSKPTAYAEVPLDRLVAFNARFGFAFLPGDTFMTRLPRAPGTAPEAADPASPTPPGPR